MVLTFNAAHLVDGRFEAESELLRGENRSRPYGYQHDNGE
jgi:hypothetical protein